MSHELCDIGASELDASGALVAQCKGVALSEDDGDAPDFGPVMFSCALGLSARPYPKTSEGSVQAVLATDVPGLSGVAVAARDLRSAGIVGNLKPGDTVLHSTGPQQAAQVQCKEDKRQVAVVTKDSRGKTMIEVLDGAGDQWMVNGFGMMINMSRAGGITLSTGAASIQITKTGQVILTGQIFLGGKSPIGFVQFSPSPVPVVGVSGTANPAPGIFIGTG